MRRRISCLKKEKNKEHGSKFFVPLYSNINKRREINEENVQSTRSFSIHQ